MPRNLLFWFQINSKSLSDNVVVGELHQWYYRQIQVDTRQQLGGQVQEQWYQALQAYNLLGHSLDYSIPVDTLWGKNYPGLHNRFPVDKQLQLPLGSSNHLDMVRNPVD
jgi:hypothetical protein